MISINWNRIDTVPKDGTKILLFCSDIYKEKKAVLRIGWWVNNDSLSGWMTRQMPGRRYFKDELVSESWPSSWKIIRHWNEEQDELEAWYNNILKSPGILGSVGFDDLIGPKPQQKIEESYLL